MQPTCRKPLRHKAFWHAPQILHLPEYSPLTPQEGLRVVRVLPYGEVRARGVRNANSYTPPCLLLYELPRSHFVHASADVC